MWALVPMLASIEKRECGEDQASCFTIIVLLFTALPGTPPTPHVYVELNFCFGILTEKSH